MNERASARDDDGTGGGPVQVLHGPTPQRAALTHLVVGWNGHAGSAAALALATDLADRLTAHLHVVHILNLDDLPIDIDAPDWDEQLDAALDDEARAARDRLNELPAGWTYYAYRGSPAVVLDDVADAHDALMVVVGAPARGAGALLRRLFGDLVAEGVIGERRRPVLVVP